MRFCNLGDEAEIIMGQSPSGDTYNVDERGTPLLNGPTEFGAVYPTAKQWTTQPTKMCEVGDILFCVRGATAGRINVADKQYCLGRGLAAIRAHEGKSDRRFVQHVLAAGYQQIRSRGVGSTFINISSEALSEFKMPMVLLSEQQRIASILDQAVTLRAKRRAALAQLDKMAQAIFVEMFGDDQSIEQDWPVTSLGDILSFMTSGSRGWATHYVDRGDIFLRIQNVGKGELNLNDVAYVQAPQTTEARRTRVQAGDVLLSITADLGRTAVVSEGIGDAYINQHLVIIRQSRLHPLFLSHFLSTPHGQAQITRRNKQGVKAGLNFDDVRSIRVPLPPRNLQDAYAVRCAQIARVRASQTESIKHLDALFTSLQHRAFRGEL